MMELPVRNTMMRSSVLGRLSLHLRSRWEREELLNKIILKLLLD
jgi:hypothetical protein